MWFLGFNLQNNQTKSYINRMIEIYTRNIFLEQWHDFIWDHVRIEFQRNITVNLKISQETHTKHVYQH